MIKKYCSNIEKYNHSYSIVLYVAEEKLQINIKYSNNNTNNIFEYKNFYSYRQLQIINKYFRYFDYLEEICLNLDKIIKKNNISIEEKYEYIILTTPVLIKNEPTNIIFKLFQNKITDIRGRNSRQGGTSFFGEYKRGIYKTTISMPKYNYSDMNDIRNILNDLSDRVSILESSMSLHKGSYKHRYNSMSKDNINTNSNYINNSMDINSNDNGPFVNNVNKMLQKMNELDELNQNKEKRINELEDILRKYKINNNKKINTQKNNIKTKKSKESIGESNEEEENNKKNKLKSKKNTKTIKNQRNSNNSNNSNNLNSSTEKREEEEDNKNNNKKVHKVRSISSDQSKGSLKKKKKKKNENEEEESKESEDNNNKKEKSKSSKSEEKNNKEEEKKESSSSEKHERSNYNSNDFNENVNRAITGLPMVGRENLRKYVNSRIFFTRKELQMVKKKITKGDKNLHALFDVIYRASIDGDYEDNIISNCEGIYPQLILFYSFEGARFGVYIEKQKDVNFFGNVTYKEIPGTSFLISLNSLRTYDILKGKKATDDRPEKLCFGRTFYFNNNESNWFIYTPRNEFLDVKCMIGDKESTFGKIDTNEIIGIKKDYRLKDVEIFKVSVESGDNFDDDDDDEKGLLNKNYVREKKIKVKNFSKSLKKDDDTIKIKNVKIDKIREEEEEEEK